MSEGTYGAPGRVAVELATVRAIYDAFARRDLEGALEHLAEDVELHLPGTAQGVGRAEPYRGHAGARAYFVDAGRVWQELTLQAEDIRAVPGGVVVFGSISGRTADGVVSRRVLWTWRLRGELAISVRVNELPGS